MSSAFFFLCVAVRGADLFRQKAACHSGGGQLAGMSITRIAPLWPSKLARHQPEALKSLQLQDGVLCVGCGGRWGCRGTWL